MENFMNAHFNLPAYAIKIADQSPAVMKMESPIEVDSSVYFQKPIWMRQEIVQILDEAGHRNWDEEGSAPVSPMTAVYAMNLVNSLPITIESPTLFPMSNGKIAFQWVKTNNTALLLSVDENGNITYSAILKNGERKNGRRAFFETLPSDIASSLLLVAV